MKPKFSYYLKIVAFVHIAIALVGFFWAGVRHLLKPKPELIVPVEFVVDVTPAMPMVEDVLPYIPEEKQKDIPDPIQQPKPKPKPKPKPEPRPKIEKGRRINRRSQKSSTPKLSKKEIEKLLAAGAKPSDHTSIPDLDTRCLCILSGSNRVQKPLAMRLLFFI